MKGNMSLRDYFAGKALECLLFAQVIVNHNSGHQDVSMEQIAADAYRVSNAMLAQREKS
jgi:hypothetical protein